MTINAVEVIAAKRDGHCLTEEQIHWMVGSYSRGIVADEQMSALAMAIFLNGMTTAETTAWTAAMLNSGERLRLSTVDRPTVDKHSTGGVGDKITLPLVPLVAACGAAVPQLSGRGLGHTGGTLDKLESIPGWRADLSTSEILRQLRTVGAVICAPVAELVPADRKLYALRDVTGTVASIPLIASSIMSKKIAEGVQSLVLDVKVGSGAFMKSLPQARQLAQLLLTLGQLHGLNTSALLTNMDVPLGKAVGNAVEVAESVAVLQGNGPADVVELTLALAGEMLALAEINVDPKQVLASGTAYETWCRMIKAQGGDPTAPLPSAAHVHMMTAQTDGVLTRLDAQAVGTAAWLLGAGRVRKEDTVQPAAGIICHAKPGMHLRKGEPLIELRTDTAEAIPVALEVLATAVEIADELAETPTLIWENLRIAPNK